jgi:proline racemase
MYGAVLTEPVSPGADAGVLFMHNEGYSTMCGHGVIAVATIAVERGLITPRHADEIVLDTPAGQVRARPRLSAREHRVSSVSFRNVPSFVLHPAVPVRLDARTIHADVAFGGAFYAIVDSEAAGLSIRGDRMADLRRAGMAIKHAVEAAVRVEHPEQADLHGIYGTIFTGPPTSGDADLRNVTIFADAEVDRSPCGTGTCAVMAVLAAMGILTPQQTFTHESVIGTRFRGRVTAEVMVGDLPAIEPEIEGEAYITGESTFFVDERDPLAYGFRIG